MAGIDIIQIREKPELIEWYNIRIILENRIVTVTMVAQRPHHIEFFLQYHTVSIGIHQTQWTYITTVIIRKARDST